VSFHVDKEGNVGPALVADGNLLLRDAAVDAVKQWRFEPYLVKGQPVEVDTFTVLQFPPIQPQKLRVSQGVAEGSLIQKVDPTYPQAAKDARIQGDMVLQIKVSPQGNVSWVKPVSGHPLFAEPAMNAVAQWKYKPYELNGEPAEVDTTVVLRFSMK
jgi:TonB family protein